MCKNVKLVYNTYCQTGLRIDYRKLIIPLLLTVYCLPRTTLTYIIHKCAEGVAKKNIGDTLTVSVRYSLYVSQFQVPRSDNPIAFKIFLSHAFCE
jgi:hypothetical protein